MCGRKLRSVVYTWLLYSIYTAIQMRNTSAKNILHSENHTDRAGSAAYSDISDLSVSGVKCAKLEKTLQLCLPERAYFKSWKPSAEETLLPFWNIQAQTQKQRGNIV